MPDPEITLRVNTTVQPVLNCCRPECRALCAEHTTIILAGSDGRIWPFCPRCAAIKSGDQLKVYCQEHPELAIIPPFTGGQKGGHL